MTKYYYFLTGLTIYLTNGKKSMKIRECSSEIEALARLKNLQERIYNENW